MESYCHWAGNSWWYWNPSAQYIGGICVLTWIYSCIQYVHHDYIYERACAQCGRLVFDSNTVFMIFESSHLASKPGNGWVQSEIVWNPFVKLASDVSVDLLHEVNKTMFYSFDASVFARFYLNALLPVTLTKGSDLSVGDSTRRFPANELVGDGTFMECALNSIGVFRVSGWHTHVYMQLGVLQGYSHWTKEWPKCMTDKKISKGSNIRDWIVSQHLPNSTFLVLLPQMICHAMKYDSFLYALSESWLLRFQAAGTCWLAWTSKRSALCLLAYLGSWDPVQGIATWQFAWRPHVRQKLLFLYSIY